MASQKKVCYLERRAPGVEKGNGSRGSEVGSVRSLCVILET